MLAGGGPSPVGQRLERRRRLGLDGGGDPSGSPWPAGPAGRPGLAESPRRCLLPASLSIPSATREIAARGRDEMQPMLASAPRIQPRAPFQKSSGGGWLVAHCRRPAGVAGSVRSFSRTLFVPPRGELAVAGAGVPGRWPPASLSVQKQLLVQDAR
ncbi:hypothetical protein SEVIR_1G294850v4 [Setaria viridis]